MSNQLGTLEDLPADYRAELAEAGVTPLWPSMRKALPHGQPEPVSRPAIWTYDSLRPLLIRAGELTPVEKAERRVLVMSDPGRGPGAMQATASIYLGLQLLLPGETAPNHVHTPSAARIVVEGEGGFTVVDGEKLPMEEGDIVLTPAGEWHEHGHEGTGPVVWLDALDLPLIYYLEGSYALEGQGQSTRNRPDASQVEYLSAGLIPVRDYTNSNRDYPMVRYPWSKTLPALLELATYSPDGTAELEYINPETGQSPLPTIGFTATYLPAGKCHAPPLRSCSSAIHIISGHGETRINGETFAWGPKDTFSIPVFAELEHQASADACFIRVHDRPLQETLKYYEERHR
ncbi:MAG: cupin domain-containing protein [Pseudomonadota bacterium]